MPEVEGFVSRLNTEMCVVTAAAGEERSGCLVGFFSQCSIRPVRFTVWLSTANHTYELARTADHLAVHLLTREQHELAALFGGECGRQVDKFAHVPWTRGHGGAVVLEDAAAWFVGTIERQVEGGDHVGFVVAPVQWGERTGGQVLRLHECLGITPGHPVD
ncbi:flavin reductase family protein [Streptomyces sp. NPDC005917]|uniref:flavin reductase family protein n=1 Tax=unclassified Streptomyces TaxID=2593676 RepID=UPI0033ED3E5F